MQDLNLQWANPRVSKTRAYTNSANPPNRLHHLVLETFYSVISLITFWGSGYSHPQYILKYYGYYWLPGLDSN